MEYWSLGDKCKFFLIREYNVKHVVHLEISVQNTHNMSPVWMEASGHVLMHVLDYNISFVFISLFYIPHTFHKHTHLSKWCWQGHWSSRGGVMCGVAFSFPCESPSGDRRRWAGELDPLTRQEWGFCSLPQGHCDSSCYLCESTNQSQQQFSLAYGFICFFFMSRVQTCSDGLAVILLPLML